MRKVFAVAALSLFIASNVSGLPRRAGEPGAEPAFVKIMKAIKRAIGSFGDVPISPRP
jgi:hypothetical protein